MNLTNALWITLIGMSLVFAAILLLWGLMALLVRVTAERDADEEVVEETAIPGLGSDAIPDAALLLERKRRAAAAAVSMALVQESSRKARQAKAEPPAGTISAWQAVNRARQISQRTSSTRKKEL